MSDSLLNRCLRGRANQILRTEHALPLQHHAKLGRGRHPVHGTVRSSRGRMLLARNTLEQTGFIASGPTCSPHMQRVASNAIA